MKSNRPSRWHKAQGFSLVELMVSLAIGLLLLTALATLFANSSRTQREVGLSAQQIENGRTAIDIVSEDLRHAGFWGYYGGRLSAPGAMPAYETHIYFVSPCSVPAGATCTAADDGGKPIPTLKRLELTLDGGGNLNMVTVPLVEGIENFQVDYGRDTDGDGSPDGAYTADPSTIPNWMQVMAVQLYVLARNTETSTGYTDNQTHQPSTDRTITPPRPPSQYPRQYYPPEG